MTSLPGYAHKQSLDKQTAVDLLGLLLGPNLVAAIWGAFTTGDFTSLLAALPVLVDKHCAKQSGPALQAACEQGRADIAGVLLQADSVDPNKWMAYDGEDRTALQ